MHGRGYKREARHISKGSALAQEATEGAATREFLTSQARAETENSYSTEPEIESTL